MAIKIIVPLFLFALTAFVSYAAFGAVKIADDLHALACARYQYHVALIESDLTRASEEKSAPYAACTKALKS